MGATVSMQGNLTKRCCQVCGVAGVRFVKINNAVHAHNQPCRRRTAVNGFPPAGAPTFASPHTRIRGGWYFPADYSACVQPITSASLAAYCSASSARAEFFQRVRWLLTGGSLVQPARSAATASHRHSKRCSQTKKLPVCRHLMALIQSGPHQPAIKTYFNREKLFSRTPYNRFLKKQSYLPCFISRTASTTA